MKTFQEIYNEEEKKKIEEEKQFIKFRGCDIEMLTIPSLAPINPKYKNNIPIKNTEVMEFINKIKSSNCASFTPISFIISKLRKYDKKIDKQRLLDKDVITFKNYINQFRNDVKTPINHPLSIHAAKMIIDKLITVLHNEKL